MPSFVPPPPSRPDWVIIGMRHGDRCVLYASRTLTQVQLQVELDHRFTPSFGPHDPYDLAMHVTATLEFHDYVAVVGASYRECLMRLFTMGEPGRWRDPEQGELNEGTRALGPG